MADEELHETTADTQEDWQSEAAESTEETTDNDAVASPPKMTTILTSRWTASKRC